VPIEDFQTELTFDLVVLINVIEHCRDVEIVFDKVDSLLSPSGILIFHDKFIETPLLKDIVSTLFDAGHPLRVDSRTVEAFLSRFEPLSRAEFRDRADFAGAEVAQTALYYVGRKQK
jgi:SAM-dependent methyltransferase